MSPGNPDNLREEVPMIQRNLEKELKRFGTCVGLFFWLPQEGDAAPFYHDPVEVKKIVRKPIRKTDKTARTTKGATFSNLPAKNGKFAILGMMCCVHFAIFVVF